MVAKREQRQGDLQQIYDLLAVGTYAVGAESRWLVLLRPGEMLRTEAEKHDLRDGSEKMRTALFVMKARSGVSSSA